ncbi:hypothetical protein D922_02622 [Enterococcus faecalis 06-MB-DW-09]|nr:hypothetical protein D922_02622 [Enterococcus faecalis 06-MB-DW-09]
MVTRSSTSHCFYYNEENRKTKWLFQQKKETTAKRPFLQYPA